MPQIDLEILAGTFSVCKVASLSNVDLSAPFRFLAQTDEELSLVCPTAGAPANALAREDGWRAFRIAGTLDFALVGILSRILTVLADAQIGIFAVSTFHTDYILVKEENFQHALSVLSDAGYAIRK